MSSSAATPSVIQSPDRLPPEVSSTLTAVWLSIGFGLVALVALWPLMLAAAPSVIEVKDPANLANLGWMALAAMVGVILLVGVAVSIQVVRKKKSGLKFLRWSMLGGMAVGLLVLVGVVALIMQSKGEAPLGPAPILSGMMLFLAGLLPFGFGIFALSYAGTDQVEAYFRPEVPAEEPSYAGAGLAGATAQAYGETVSEVSEAVVEEPAGEPLHAPVAADDAGLDRILDDAAAPSAGAGDLTRETQVFMHGQHTGAVASADTMLQPALGGKRDTMLAPSGDALDAILNEEAAPAEAPASAAGSQSGEAPLSPEALDAIFSGEEGDAPDLVPAGAEMPGSFSDSIFDEEDLPPEQLDHGQQRVAPDLLAEGSFSSGESSIFSDANPLAAGSEVISGMANQGAAPEIVMPESGQNLPQGKNTMLQPASEKPKAKAEDEPK